MRLRIDGGLWQDQGVERFELIDGFDTQTTSTTTTEKKSVRTDAAAKQAPTPKVPQWNGGASKSQPLNGFVVAYGSRGLNGELSELEVDLFISDAIWDQTDSLIVLKPAKRVKPMPQ